VSLVAAGKQRVLPSGRALRKVPFGIGRGIVIPVDFSKHTRLFLGLYEVELNRFLRAFCGPGTTCFDVGAQLGYDALVLAQLTRSPVISFEANAELAAEMSTTFAANGVLGRLTEARHAYVGAASDGTSIALDDVAYGDGFIPDFMKIDIDGAEVDALQGAVRILRERRPHLIIETHSQQLERGCALILRDAGYAPTVVHQRRIWPDHRPTDHNRWLIARGTDQGAKLS
jgi:methyltransferase FkbM-like protein